MSQTDIIQPNLMLGINTNSSLQLYDVFDAVNIAHEQWKIKGVEIAGERELSDNLYHRDRNAFIERYSRLRELIEHNEQVAIAASSWNRENSWVSEDDTDKWKSGLSILEYQTDIARIIDAPYMMTPLCTVRGRNLTKKVIWDRIDNGIKAWVKASQYAAEVIKKYGGREGHGGPLEMLEIEKMSQVGRDIPSNIEETDYVLGEIDRIQKKEGRDCVPVGLRLDVAHWPSKEDCSDPKEFDFSYLVNRYFSHIVAFHLKGYIEDDVGTIVPMVDEYERRGREITHGLIDAIEKLNPLRAEQGLQQLETVYVVYEPLNVKERKSRDVPVLDLNRRAIENTRGFFEEKDYVRHKDGLWRKAA